jgi:hypothetical protein
MKQRNLDYEKKFKSYLFKGNVERFKLICENIGVQNNKNVLVKEEKKTIIRLWDNEDYDYPLLEINIDDVDKIKQELEQYQEEDTYNFDDFISLLEEKGYDVKTFSPDLRWFF